MEHMMVSAPEKRSVVGLTSVVGSPRTEFGGCFRKAEHLLVASMELGAGEGEFINQMRSTADR